MNTGAPVKWILVNERINSCMNEYTQEWMNKIMHKRIHEWMSEKISEFWIKQELWLHLNLDMA